MTTSSKEYSLNYLYFNLFLFPDPYPQHGKYCVLSSLCNVQSGGREELLRVNRVWCALVQDDDIRQRIQILTLGP